MISDRYRITATHSFSTFHVVRDNVRLSQLAASCDTLTIVTVLSCDLIPSQPVAGMSLSLSLSVFVFVLSPCDLIPSLTSCLLGRVEPLPPPQKTILGALALPRTRFEKKPQLELLNFFLMSQGKNFET